MALNFPSNPNLNDTYSLGNKTWVWNGTYWEFQSTGSINDIPIGNTIANSGNFTSITSQTITNSGNITAGNILTDNYFYANGEPFVSSNYGDSDVGDYLTTYTGNITAGNISVSGAIDGYATTTYVDSEVANLVASAPSTLDTLNELAAALNDDANFATTITNLIGNNSANITTLQGNITTLESDISNLEANIPADLQSNVTTLEGNIVSIESDVSTLQGNIIALDDQVANLNYYDDTNVTTFLSDIGSNTIITTGNITANYFIGNGSQLTGIDAGSAVTVGNVTPTSPSNGDTWFNTDSGIQYVYIDDGDSSQWVETQADTVLNISVSENYGDSNVLSYLGNISGNLIPSANVTYNLGSSTNQWHSLYVGPGSLYVNNKKVIEDDSGRITVSTSVNQNLAIKTTGSGDIELFPEGTGVVNIQGNVQADSGVIISGTGGLKFGSNLNLDNNNINNLDDPVQAQDAATKAYVDTQITSAQGNYSNTNVASYLTTYTGNIAAGNISVTGTIDGYATTSYVDSEVANLVASAPSTLDTLNELAAALGNDPNLSTTLTSLIGNNSANITTLQGNITSIESDITNLEANIPADLQSNVTTLEGNITSIETDISNLEANIPANLQSNVTTLESDVSTLQGNIVSLDNQVANLNYYDDTNVTTFLSDIGSNAITTTGDITANSFIGDGSQLTGLPASYSDSNVASYLPTYTGNITAGNILTDNYFYANGEAFVSGGGNSLTLANSAPSSPNNGDIWVDSDTGREYTYINDGDSLQWVELATSFIDINSYDDSNVLAYLGNISGNLIPSANVTYDLGSETNRWNTLYLAGNTINLGGAQIKADPGEGTITLIPQIKTGETVTKAIVIGQQGIATVDTNSNGTVSTEAIQEAATNPNITTTNMFVNSNAYITGNITAGNILTDNYFYANGEAFISGGGGTSAETAIFNFPTTINSNLTIESGNNGLSVGPITQANNTVISINAGQRWIIL